MRNNLKRIAGLALMGSLLGTAGCGHTMLKPAPRVATPIAVIYTGRDISGMSDVPIGTYELPDSQVIISGHQKASRSPASMMFGVLGVVVANQIDKSGGKSAVKSVTDVLHLKLSPDAEQNLASLLGEDQFKEHFTATPVRGDPQLEFSGSIVLTFVDDTQVYPYVVLHATLKQYPRNPALTDAVTLWSTRYMSSIGASKPLEGPDSWTENDAASLKATISAELKQAMHYMLADVQEPESRDEARRIVVAGHFPFIPDRYEIVSYDLGEDGDSIAFAPQLSDATILAGVLLVDKSQVVVRAATKGDRSKKLDPPKGM